MLRTIFFIVAGASILSACHAPQRSVDFPPEQDLPSPSVDNPNARGPNNGVVITREWEDVHKTEDGGRQYFKVQIGYDYDRKKAFWNEYDLDGNLVSERYEDWMPIGTTSEETNYAFELALAHPEVAESVTDYDITLHGGFQYMRQDDPYCGHVSRCVHVFAFDRDTDLIVSHSIVDLLSNRVVHPVYDYDPGSWVKARGE